MDFEKNALSERISATGEMLIKEQDHGHYELEDYGYVLDLSWFEHGGVVECDLAVTYNEKTSRYTARLKGDLKPLLEKFVRESLG